MLEVKDLLVRDLLAADIDAVLKIERGVQIMPWARLSFEQALNAENICRVVLYKESIIAFHIFSTVLDELHILNIAVSSSFQGYGVGHVLLDDIVNLAEKIKVDKLFLEVRESNQIALSLYEKWGFKQLSLRKNYYRLPGTSLKENALVLMKEVKAY